MKKLTSTIMCVVAGLLRGDRQRTCVVRHTNYISVITLLHLHILLNIILFFYRPQLRLLLLLL